MHRIRRARGWILVLLLQGCAHSPIPGPEPVTYVAPLKPPEWTVERLITQVIERQVTPSSLAPLVDVEALVASLGVVPDSRLTPALRQSLLLDILSELFSDEAGLRSYVVDRSYALRTSTRSIDQAVVQIVSQQISQRSGPLFIDLRLIERTWKIVGMRSR